MYYRSVADLNRAMVDWHSRLPDDIELIAGVPRSGLLAANLLALHMNLPLTDVDGLIAGRMLTAGARYKTGTKSKGDAGPMLETPRKVLIIEDYVLSGRSLEKVRAQVEKADLPHSLVYGSVYADPAKMHLLDHYYELVTPPTYFEWNLLHHPWVEKSCIDLEGVLCREPSPEENQDGKSYEAYIASAEPLLSTTKTVGHVISCRAERYRAATGGWLEKHGIRYHHLHMLGDGHEGVRADESLEADYKAQLYTDVDGALFFESSSAQAEQIARKTGRYVFCTETREMMEPSSSAQLKRVVKREASAGYRRLQDLLRHGIRGFLYGRDGRT
jgi:orotate phosphoribosyltransferase